MPLLRANHLKFRRPDRGRILGAAFAWAAGMNLQLTTTTDCTRFRPGVAALVAGTALAVSACGSDSGGSPESTQARITANLPGVVDNATASMDVLANSETLAAVADSVGAMGGQFGLGGDADVDDGFRLLRDGHGGDFFDDEMSGDEFAEFLSEVVFTDENYEGDGYYRLPVELLCPPDFTGEIPAECVEEIEEVELRIRALLVGDDGVDISLAVGPERFEPIILELRPSSLAVVADLGAIRDAAVFLADLAGEALDDIPEVLEGVVAASLIVHGDEHVSIEAAVREAITVEGDGVSLSLGANDPMLALEVNGPEESVTAGLDVGRFQLAGPWDEMDEESSASGELAIDWRGLSAEVTLQEDAQSLQIENISLGDDTSTISLDGHVLLAVDLNAESGRSLTLTVLPEEGAHPTFGFDPEFDLSLGFGLQPLADAGDDVPEFLLDDVLRFAVTGSQPTIQGVDAEGEFEGGIRVVSGELSVSSDEGGEVVVAEGQCLIGVEPEEGDHPLIGSFAEGSCE